MTQVIKSDKALIISRIDYFDKGYRRGLLELVGKIAEYEKPGYLLINGGLVSYYGFIEQLKLRLECRKKQNLKKKAEEAEKPKAERELVLTTEQSKKEAREELIQEAVDELKEAIPKIVNKQGRNAKIYISIRNVTSYDGPIGQEIAERLQDARSDIFLWDPEGARFPFKYTDKVLWALSPSKAAWRGEYYSRPLQNIIKDKERILSLSLPDLWVGGCLASSVNKPAGGESTVHTISIPALHKIHRVQTSENQVGICIVEAPRDNDPLTVRIYDFRDILAKERELIPLPKALDEDPNASKQENESRNRQREIFKEVTSHVPTIGMLEDALPWERSTIERDIKEYNERGLEPSIILDRQSGKYDVDQSWLREKATYSFPNLKQLDQDAILGFGCLHAGYKTTQYKWFIDRLPELILRYDVNTLVGAGDYIAGLKHDLFSRGELIPSLSRYSEHEKLAAELIGNVLVRTFKSRFNIESQTLSKESSEQNIRNAVEKSLPYFRYDDGNHDEWVRDLGFNVLATFQERLAGYITKELANYLVKHGFNIYGIDELVLGHLIYNSEHVLDSGVTLSIRHPHQGRTLTWSGRAQQTLQATSGQVVALANFHTSVSVVEYNYETGPRLALQLGTIVAGTEFEDNMNKRVDTGVGIARVYSDPKTHRILITEIIWASPSKDEIVIWDTEEELNKTREKLYIKK